MPPGKLLGSGTNTAAIYAKGGGAELLPLASVSGIEWGRNRNAFSTAKVTVTADDDNYGQLGDVHTWAHELVVFRDRRRVWEGPIRLIDYGSGDTVFSAVDVLGWLAKRTIKLSRQVASLSPVTTEMEMDLTRAFAADDPNVLAHRLVLHHADEAGITRDVLAYSGKYDGDFTSMAGQGGNFTVVGRSAIIYPDEVLLGRLNTLQANAHTTADARVQENGDDLATDVTAVNSDGLRATTIATSADVNGSTAVSDYYGLHDNLLAADSVLTTSGLTAVSRAAVAQLFPAPVVISLPGDSQLRVDAPFTIEQLVPGVMIPVESSSTPRKASGTMILDTMKVVQDSTGEKVTISVANASAYAGIAEGG